MYSFFQTATDRNKFAIIKGEVTPAGYPRGHEGIDWKYITYKGEVVLDSLILSDAREITEKLNAGAEISDFAGSMFEGDNYYGCPLHQAFGDSWFYQDCPEAW